MKFENETVLNYVYNCAGCKLCESHCSIYLTTGKNSALDKLKILGKIALNEVLSQDESFSLFTCTKCESCQQACPKDIPLMSLFDWGRNSIVSSQGFINPKQETIINNINSSGNPFNIMGDRFRLLKNFIPNLQDYFRPNSRTLLHLGCMLNYRIPQMAIDLINILNLLGVDFTLDEKETCCGYFIWNCGDHLAASETIQKNSQSLEKYDEIICACAGCYTFFRGNYPKRLNSKFKHVIEVISENLPNMLNDIDGYPLRKKEKDRVMHENSQKKIIFHDSCHLTRPWGIIKPPRDVLSALGYEIIEFDNSKENNTCCGADGGMRFINKELALKIGASRVENASRKARTLSTLCPFCIFNFRESSQDNKEIEISSLYHQINDSLEKMR